MTTLLEPADCVEGECHTEDGDPVLAAAHSFLAIAEVRLSAFADMRCRVPPRGLGTAASGAMGSPPRLAGVGRLNAGR